MVRKQRVGKISLRNRDRNIGRESVFPRLRLIHKNHRLSTISKDYYPKNGEKYISKRLPAELNDIVGNYAYGPGHTRGFHDNYFAGYLNNYFPKLDGNSSYKIYYPHPLFKTFNQTVGFGYPKRIMYDAETQTE